MAPRPGPNSRAWWWASLATVALLGIAALGASAQAPAPSELGQTLKNTDLNHDGRIDREEFYRVMVEAFFFRDRDKDGYLILSEVTELSAEAFRGADRNGDGRLSLDEYVNALFKDFDAADRDKDGVLTYEELEIYVRAARR